MSRHPRPENATGPAETKPFPRSVAPARAAIGDGLRSLSASSMTASYSTSCRRCAAFLIAETDLAVRRRKTTRFFAAAYLYGSMGGERGA